MTKQSVFPNRDSQKVQQATLCFLVKGKEVLLAMKKRGFGEGLWNGVGGKVALGESIKGAAQREALEEVDIKMVNTTRVATLHFYFPDEPSKKGWNQDVHVFLVKKWTGNLKETEEMKPRWFEFSKIPFKKMWADDPLWLPAVLGGRIIEGWFSFGYNNEVLAHRLKNVAKGGKVSSKR